MKKILSFLVVLMLSVTSCSLYAYDFSAVAPTGQTLYYNIYGGSGMYVYVTCPASQSYNGYTKPTGNLTIPDLFIYNNQPYVVIGIDGYAFYQCSGLTSVNIPSTLNFIGYSAFSGCSSLTSIIVSGGSFGSDRYDSRDNCNAIIETSTNTLIAGCQNTVIPNSVTSIGPMAFKGCSGLTSVTIPNSVTSIGSSAFSGCSGLTSVTIGNSVINIGDSAFRDCSRLTTLNFNADSCVYAGNGSNNRAFLGCDSISIVNIGSNVKLIPSYLLYGCTRLTSVTIPNSVTYINNYAFSGCSNLTEIWLKPTTPPTLGNASSLGADTVPLIVPHNSYNAYTSSGTYYTNHLIYCDSTIVTSHVNNPEWGYVTGGDTIFAYPDVTNTIAITATAIGHCHFVHWNDGNTDNPRQVVIECDTAFTAFFAIDIYTVSVSTNDITRGMVQSSGTEFEYGVPCTVTATAYTGYSFVKWSNGVTANPYTFAVTNDIELTAIFLSPDEMCTVTVVSANPTMGAATVDESSSTTVMSGEEVALSATPFAGYRFVQWQDNDTHSHRTVTVTSTITYTAYFAPLAGIREADDDNGFRVFAQGGQIVVEDAGEMPVMLYDATGRLLATRRNEDVLGSTPLRFAVPASGTYLIKVGNYPARKVVVIR